MEKKLISLDEFIRKLAEKDALQSDHKFVHVQSLANSTPIAKVKYHNIPHTFEKHSFKKSPASSLFQPATTTITGLKRQPGKSGRKRIFSNKSINFKRELDFEELAASIPQVFKPCSCVGSWDVCLPLERLIKREDVERFEEDYYILKDKLTTEAWLSQLRLDLPRTNKQIPTFFYPTIESVVRVTLKHLQLEYVQGMNFIAGQLIAHIKIEWKAFLILSSIFDEIRDWFIGDLQQSMGKQIATFANKLQSKLPTLAKHLRLNGIQPTHFILKWLLTFMGNKIPLNLMSQLYNKVAQQGKDYLYKIIILYLAACQDRLLRISQEELLLQLLKQDKNQVMWARILMVAKDYNQNFH